MITKYTIPEKAKSRKITRIIIGIDGPPEIRVAYDEDGPEDYLLSREDFATFWNSSIMTTKATVIPKNVVKQFFKKLIALTHNIDVTDVTGEFDE